MNRSDKAVPESNRLIIVKIPNNGEPLVSIGIYREQGGKKYFVSMLGEQVSWARISVWDYLLDMAPKYDVWNQDVRGNRMDVRRTTTKV